MQKWLNPVNVNNHKNNVIRESTAMDIITQNSRNLPHKFTTKLYAVKLYQYIQTATNDQAIDSIASLIFLSIKQDFNFTNYSYLIFFAN